jgi:AraC-like DNA-binding protein
LSHPIFFPMPLRPIFEKIRPNPGSSFYAARFEGGTPCPLSYWHLHPEYELVYINQGAGPCHVGRHQSMFEGGLLIMLGPNLPHAPFGFGPQLAPGTTEVVVQFQGDLLGADWAERPEWQGVRELLRRSGQGVMFGKRVKEQLGPRLIELVDEPPLPRLLSLVTTLGQLAEATDHRLLEAGEPGLLLSSADYDRIHRVMAYLQAHFREPIALQTAANLVHLTVPAFCRFFKRITQKTFSHYLHEYRIYHACRLLQDRQLNMGEIAYHCGYQQAAYFNRQFKRIMGQTPSEYQRQYARWVEVTAEE